jgi:hypothetical protein
MINPYNFTRPEYGLELSEILCKNCTYRMECFDMDELDDCDTYVFAMDNMKDEEDK